MKDQHDPAQVPEYEIVGKPTMFVKYEGRLDAEQILGSLQRIGYPLEDVSALFKVGGGEEVIDLLTGRPAAGQAITEEELKPKQLTNGQTVVLLHPEPDQVEKVRQALSEVGNPQIEYTGATHAFSRLDGVERIEEPDTPGGETQVHKEPAI